MIRTVGLLLLAGCAAGCATEHQQATTETAERVRFLSSDRALTPEETIRAFMIAVARQDEQTARRLSYPGPHTDKVLAHFRGEPPLADEFAALMTELQISELHAGDDLRDPFTPGQKIKQEWVDAGVRFYATHTKGYDAWTYFLVEYEGRWVVDMRWFVIVLDKLKPQQVTDPTNPPH